MAAHFGADTTKLHVAQENSAQPYASRKTGIGQALLLVVVFVFFLLQHLF